MVKAPVFLDRSRNELFCGIAPGRELHAKELLAGGFDGSDVDDLSDLGDMIVAAYRDAKAQADALAAEALGPLGGGGLPGLG